MERVRRVRRARFDVTGSNVTGRYTSKLGDKMTEINRNILLQNIRERIERF